jgi:hypothetical protein
MKREGAKFPATQLARHHNVYPTQVATWAMELVSGNLPLEYADRTRVPNGWVRDPLARTSTTTPPAAVVDGNSSDLSERPSNDTGSQAEKITARNVEDYNEECRQIAEGQHPVRKAIQDYLDAIEIMGAAKDALREHFIQHGHFIISLTGQVYDMRGVGNLTESETDDYEISLTPYDQASIMAF